MANQKCQKVTLRPIPIYKSKHNVILIWGICMGVTAYFGMIHNNKLMTLFDFSEC